MSQNQPGTISYPNRITDHFTATKLREMIDHANNLKMSHDQNVAETAKNTAAIAALPETFLTRGDVNSQINMALGTNGTITSYIVKLLKASGVSVPEQLPPFP